MILSKVHQRVIGSGCDRMMYLHEEYKMEMRTGVIPDRCSYSCIYTVDCHRHRAGLRSA